MSTDPSTPENDANLSGLGRALLESQEGSKPSGPWVPPTAEELGRLLPEYDILKMLGRGGMGAVYMGRQKSLDRAVAIKILSTALEDADPSFAERFKNEARAMGKLNFAGIVAVHDFGEAKGGLLYIVMEYVEGTDVARMIAKEGRLHTEHAMAITAHVCDALAYAHERGIIHRDIKPANIMVGYDGVVKVADFGLAKMTHSQNTGLTQSGMAMGTLHYMAPEALMLGSAVDHRADIYAVGVMLYQMLTGKIPQGMFKLPSLQIPGLDPRYDAIIAKGIMEDREARYQSVGEMRRDLDGILTQPVVKVEAEVSQAPAALPIQARPQRPGARQSYRPPQPAVHAPMSKSSSGWLVWTMLGLCVLGGGYVWMTSQSTSMYPSSKMTATSPKPVPPNPFEAVDPPDQPMPPAPVAPSVPTPTVPGKSSRIDGLVTDGQWQDVLKRIGENSQDKAGAWTYASGVLKCVTPSKDASISIPTSPLASYSARLRFMSADHRKLTIMLPTPGNGIAFSLWDFEKKVGWLLPKDICLESKALTQPTNDGREHELVVEVSPSRLNATLDGVDCFSQTNPDWKLIAQTPLYPRTTAMGLGVGVHQGVTEFRSFEIRILSPAEATETKSTPMSSSPFDLQQLPDFRTRVANYQKARHAKLSDLTTRYRAALTDAKSRAPADAAAYDTALARAAVLMTEIEKNLTATEVRPLPALAATDGAVPQRLKELSDIFEKETAKLETGLVTDLDQSLSVVQASLTQAGRLDAAKALEDYRTQLAAVAFVMAGSKQPGALPSDSYAITPVLQATKENPFVNSLGMKFVPIRITGGPTDGKTLLFSVWETRVRDFAEFAKSNAMSDSSWQNLSEGGATQTGDHPVVNVSWEDAVKFCEWLSKKDSLIYRLPSDHEWSCAGGLGLSENPALQPANKSPKKGQAAALHFPWGNDDQPPVGFANYQGTQRDRFPFTAPVGSFLATAEGLHDLWGNASEWCADWNDSSAKAQRVIRGHSWFNFGPYRASSQRITMPRGGDGKTVGFRVVLELP